MENVLSTQQQPTIVKVVQSDRLGIESHKLSRHAIGYILRGKKYIHYGDTRHEINRGDIFYMCSGNHYTENVPEDGKPFEQIIIYYTPDQLSRILTNLSMNYGLEFTNDHACENCRERSHVIFPSWNTVRNFFSTINQYMREGLFANDTTAENLKMTELVYLIFSRPDCCIKSKILEHSDHNKETFEQIMYRNIFNVVPIEELARQCNRSLTSFKKEFKKHFHEPPHKWFIRQRLMHSRHLLISTSKSIQEIGAECNFPNTSHFIKLFRKEYGMTPNSYRYNYKEGPKNELKKKEKTKKE